MPHRPVSPEHRAFARDLRARTADPERLLWWAVRDRRLGGWRFRRQVPMGRFVLDFFCPQTALAIELDGPTHDADADRERDAWLSVRGIRVMRFSNGEVLSNLDGVLATILSAGGGHGLDRS